MIEREMTHSSRANVPEAFKSDLITLRGKFPLPKELVKQQQNLARIAEVTDFISQAFSEMLKVGPRDVSDRIEANRPSIIPSTEKPIQADIANDAA